ncbi:MAG TPA: hypothetical protein VGC85_07305 [Chthoniobacterales bacterium]
MGQLAGMLFFAATATFAQSIAIPWSGHAHDPQHSNISRVASQRAAKILWSTTVDQQRQYNDGELFIHYGAPLITRQNTILLPVKVGADDTFQVEARAADGTLKWVGPSDYSLPPHNWVPSYGIALTPKNRVYYPGAGGSVYFRDSPDAPSGSGGQLVFYGADEYAINPATFNQNVKINTPITSDRYGNIFFGFIVLGSNPANLVSGIARIGEDGSGTWIFARAAANDSSIHHVVYGCAPALSNDQKTMYVAVSYGSYSGGYLLALDSRTLAPLARVRLRDSLNPGNDAVLSDDGSAAPTIGPDGDVYYGVLENYLDSNHLRGYLLHFDATLSQSKIPGSFGWDDTASIVPASAVPSYNGSSSYLVLTKYNNYVEHGGDGVSKLAILDPNDTQTNPINGATVMKEVITIVSPTPDDQGSGYPNAVREWCINSAVVDVTTKSALASCEDGHLYRWDFTTNTLTDNVELTNGLGEAYTPTVVGVDGIVYSIANGTLFVTGPANE